MRSMAFLFLLIAGHTASAETVCMVGDSVVARGGDWRHDTAQQTAAGNMPFEYLGNYEDGQGYLHDGVGGHTTQNVLDRIDGYFDSNGNYIRPIPVCDITILHVGGNDLLKYKLGPKAIANNVRDIANQLAARGSKVYVGTILPFHEGPCDQLIGACDTDRVTANLWIAATNYYIKDAIAKETAYTHSIVDHWKAFTSSGLPAWQLYVDSFHPSKAGYGVLAAYDVSVIAP